MRNEIMKWNPVFLRTLRSIYSYFGIVWNQNTMNKLNPYSNRSISWHFVFWLQFSVKSREQVEGSDVNYQNVKLTFFRVQRCSPAQNSVLKNLKLTWCIFQRKITTWVNRNIKLWAKTALNFLLPWQRWYWYRTISVLSRRHEQWEPAWIEKPQHNLRQISQIYRKSPPP